MAKVECTRIPDGNSYVLVPNKLLQYAKACLPKDMRITALNLYMMFGRQTPETTMQMLDKYQNILCTNFPIDKINEIMTSGAEDYIFQAIDAYMQGKVMLIEKKIIFEVFKPWINAYIDPSYILYNLAFRRPPAYKIILSTTGGFEWVKNICLKIREHYGMMDPAAKPFMMEPWEIKAMFPASEVMGRGEY